jgi:FkbM family methyltransferase
MKIVAPVSSDLVWAKSVGGDVQVSLDDHVGRALYFFGDLDPKVTWVIKRLLKPGDLALDIGANFGFLTLLMSKLVGPQGAVHAFEPNPILCNILKTTYAHNCATNVTLHAVALGASTAEMELHVPKDNFGGASLVRKPVQSAHILKVPVIKLDDVIFREPISRLALIKLDVEGFELEVLKGAQRVLREFHPIVLFESNEQSNDEQITPVIKFLQEYNYNFLTIPRRFVRMRTRVVDLDRPCDIRGNDVVGIPNGESFTKLRQLLRGE